MADIALRIPPSPAPTSPEDGRMWVTSAGLFVQINGSTVGPLGTGSGTLPAWRSGSGVPSSGLGNNGDYYLNTATEDVYTKVAGSWGSPITNIKGATGAAGSNGTNGTNGTNGATWFTGSGAPSSGTGNNNDLYLDTASGNVYKKVSGSWGSAIENLTGPTGLTGPNYTISVSTSGPSGTGVEGQLWFQVV